MFTVLLLTCCLSVPADVTIDAEGITLGNLIAFPASDPRASISLGYAPQPGLARRIAKHEIVNKIRAAGLGIDDLQLPDSVLVRRKAASLDSDQVSRAILDAFIKTFPDANVQIVAMDIPQVQIGTGAVEIVASLPQRFDLVNSIFIRLDIRGTSFSRTAFVRTKVHVEGEQGTIRNSPAPVPVVSIRKGDSVTVKSISGAVTIAATMRAKTGGKIGDTIQVEHLSGEGSTTARIVGPRTLEAIF